MIGMDDYKVDDECLLACDKVGPEELLEDCWFFGNAKMTSITPSDPSQETEKLSVDNPTRRGSYEGGRRRRRSKDLRPTSSSSLPQDDHFEDGDEDEEEMEFSMGKLIRQASLNHSPTNPPKKQQGVTSASWMQQSEKKAEVESPRRPQRVMSRLNSQKSLSALQCKEVGGGGGGLLLSLESKSVGHVSNEEEEELERKKSGERKLTRTQSWAPPVPVKWGGKKSKEDIKTQIKFWARAVASNVNPE